MVNDDEVPLCEPTLGVASRYAEQRAESTLITK